MKFIKKKLIRHKEYYYFEYTLNLGGIRQTFTRYLGEEIPADIKERFSDYFAEIAEKMISHAQPEDRKYFPPRGLETIEKYRFQHKKLTHELFEKDFSLFKSLFYVLFVLNSNRAEGSKATKKDVEEVITKKIKPKTLIEKEVANSVEAINYALSKEMKWNQKSIRLIHRKLFYDIRPEIAGKYRRMNVVVGNAHTVDWPKVKIQINSLLRWFHRNGKMCPPKLALEFHWRFEEIHPFEDGNGRVGRILLNALLIQQGYSPAIFFSENHLAYCHAISQAREGKKLPLAKHFVESLKKTDSAIRNYRREGVITGGSTKVGRWEIQRGKIRRGF